MKRSSSLSRTTPISNVSSRRKTERAEYTREAARYLALHPYCQIFIFRHELSEEAVLRGKGQLVYMGKTIRVPRASQIHHRNKRDGARLLDQRWWMSASAIEHDWVEHHKDVARALGLLLPINATIDGTWGDGQRALETPALMAKKARRS